MLILTLVRHGETKMNAAKIVQSRTPGELTERGIRMAERLGEKLREEKFTRVYSSDLKRCHDTTLHILQHSNHPQPDINLKQILRERDYGDMEFQPVHLVHEKVAAFGCALHAVPLPGAETYEQTMGRTATFFQVLCELADEEEGENVLAVSHGNWIQCLVDYIISNKQDFKVSNLDELILEKGSPRNTSTTKMTIESKKEQSLREINFLSLYDASHLDSL